MCLKPILQDESFLDARGNPMKGYGEIKIADDYIMKD